MKKLFKAGAFLLSALIATSGLAACGGGGGNGSDVEIDSSGNIIVRPGQDVTEITFWGYGDNNELSVFSDLVKNFNEINKGVIKVNYKPQVSGDYSDATNLALAGNGGVDILYVGDADFKQYAEQGYLEPLDNYLATSSEVVIDEMWETSVNRFKYDVTTTTQDGPNAHYWGIPKDIGPTVIFYNETYFNEAGVTVISVAADDLAAFNSGAADSRGKTKAQYGITSEVKEKGYFELDGKKWFNNQVPMSWDECVVLSELVQTAARKKMGRQGIYGYFTEWWFNYGWSVGGDCIEYVATDDPAYNGGYWDFTLMEDTPNYIVADDAADFTINGNTYKAGEIIAWADKLVSTTAPANERAINSTVLAAAEAGQLNELPSQRDAFVEFVRVGQKTSIEVDAGLKGYGICPDPQSIGGDGSKAIAFTEGNVAMLVDGRWNVTNFRQVMDKTNISQYGHPFAWDVAPLPMYKEYDAEGNITVHGVEAGHSGSVALCINAKSKYKNAAWKFAEYIGGATGQTAQAESGFAIPSQKDIANSEVFLQSDQNPKNAIVFVRAAEHQTPGDWWYLRDNNWIDDWALDLNGEVRNGRKTLSQFETGTDYLKTWDLLKEYTKKK